MIVGWWAVFGVALLVTLTGPVYLLARSRPRGRPWWPACVGSGRPADLLSPDERHVGRCPVCGAVVGWTVQERPLRAVLPDHRRRPVP